MLPPIPPAADEHTCIGCKQCVWQAPATFRIENTHGRSRVFAQW
jgi:ferredoxin